MKVIFVDIDGTLYDHVNKTIPESALVAIKKAREKGHKVFVCTGRALSQSTLFINLNFDGYIFCAGTVVYADKKLLYKKPIELDEVNRLIKFFDENEIKFSLEGDFGTYCSKNSIDHLKKYFCDEDLNEEETMKELNKNGIFSLSYWDNRDQISKMCTYGKQMEDFDAIYEHIKDYNLTISLADEERGLYAVELTLKNHNKSIAAKKVLDYYGLGYEDAIAIGDSDNDFEIIRDCGIGIAMGNAHPKELEIADYITDNIENDGVYNAFKYFDLI